MSRRIIGSTTGITSGPTSRSWRASLVALLGLMLAAGSTPALGDDEKADQSAPEVVVETPEGGRPMGAGMGAGRGQRGGPRRGGPRGPEEMVSQLTEQLALSETQQSEVRKILEAQREKRETLRNDALASGDRSAAREQMQSMRNETHEKIDALLSEEQSEKFAEIRRQRQSRMQQGQGRGQGQGPGPGERRGGGRRGMPETGTP